VRGGAEHERGHGREAGGHPLPGERRALGGHAGVALRLSG
jgi:hypothetical protein